MKVGSLCSGYGGLDLGLLSVVPGEVTWFVENDKHPSAILAAHHPDVPNYGNIKTLDYSKMERVDWLTAGYPCQPFSNAGKGLGEKDPRHLWPYIAQAICALRPPNVLLENVRGHLRRGFGTVLGSLADLGYDASWVCVRASDVGAPHRRERIFILAADASGGPLSRVAAEGDRLLVAPQRGHRTTTDSSSERYGERQNRPGMGRLDGGDEVEAWQREWAWKVPGYRSVALFGRYAEAVLTWERTTYRLAPRPTANGRLNPCFVEWMMGLPAGYVTDIDIPVEGQVKALGNGVVPQQAALALRLLSC